MPEQEEGVMEGFQLWLNLPARDKMRTPWYRDFTSAEIPRYTTDDGVAVQVIAGESHGVTGAVQRELTEPLYLDIDLPAGSSFEQPLPPGHNAFLYTFRGEVQVDGKAVPALRMAIFANTPGSDGVRIEAPQGGRVILVAGQPLNEPIAQYGPFVMNTQAEVFQAVQDFREGKFGETAAQ
jgi:redox-sensitive bicupin YhaK (pirin superfamily)